MKERAKYRQNNAHESGMTLLELLLGLLFLAILLVSAIPKHSQLFDSFNRAIAQKQFTDDLRRARSEALASGARCIVSIPDGGASYEIGLDYFPYSNTLTPDVRVTRVVLPNQISISASANIAFDPRGYTIDATGQTSQVSVSLEEENVAYSSGSVYAAGYVEF